MEATKGYIRISTEEARYLVAVLSAAYAAINENQFHVTKHLVKKMQTKLYEGLKVVENEPVQNSKT